MEGLFCVREFVIQFLSWGWMARDSELLPSGVGQGSGYIPNIISQGPWVTSSVLKIG